MRTPFRLISLALACSLSIGCQKNEPESQSMMHQVLSAMQIPDQADRDSALASACRECALAGDVESVLLGIPRIEDEQLRDEVAHGCVEGLVSADKRESVKNVVELIIDPAIRDEVSRILNAE